MLVKHIKIFLRKKNKKNGEYGREPYKNISDEKRKLAEYKKIYDEMRKNALQPVKLFQ